MTNFIKVLACTKETSIFTDKDDDIGNDNDKDDDYNGKDNDLRFLFSFSGEN